MSKSDVPNDRHAAKDASNLLATHGASFVPDDPTISSAKQAFKAWYGFQDAAKEMLKYSEALGKVEEVLDRHNAMENATHSKDAHIAMLEAANQYHIDGYDKRYSAWTEEKGQFERRVKELESSLAARDGVTEKQKITHAQAVAQMKKDLEKEKNDVAKLTKELETANTKTQEANKKLGRCMEQLKEWESNLSLLKELDFKVLSVDISYRSVHVWKTLTFCYSDGKVKLLSTHCYKIARTHFLRDLSKEAFLVHLVQ